VAAAQVGVDAMNVSLNPGSTATSALGAVGREGEMREVADVLVGGMQNAITNAMGPFADTVATGFRQHSAAIEAVKRKQDKADQQFLQNKKQLTEQKKQLTEQKKALVDVKKKLDFDDKDKQRFDAEYATNWTEVDTKFAEVSAENAEMRAENKALKARMDKLEAGAVGCSSTSSGASWSRPVRAPPAAGLGVEFEAHGISALVYHQEKYAFTPMMYITQCHRVAKWKLQMRTEYCNQTKTSKRITIGSYSISELQQKRLLWCVQRPSTPAAVKARNLYITMVEHPVPIAAQSNAHAGEASSANGAAPARGRVSGLATLACAARALVASRATSAEKRT
jgi:hypothetical protein